MACLQNEDVSFGKRPFLHLKHSCLGRAHNCMSSIILHLNASRCFQKPFSIPPTQKAPAVFTLYSIHFYPPQKNAQKKPPTSPLTKNQKPSHQLASCFRIFKINPTHSYPKPPPPPQTSTHTGLLQGGSWLHQKLQIGTIDGATNLSLRPEVDKTGAFQTTTLL